MWSKRIVLVGVALWCWGLVAWALVLQHRDGLDPCPLCILQRYGFLWAGLMALVASTARDHRPHALARPAWWLAVVGLLAGAVASVKQLWVIAHPTVTCGRDELEIWVNSLPPAKWLPEVFYADGLCGAELPKLFGFLSIPVGALLGFAAAMVLLLLAFRKKERRLFG